VTTLRIKGLALATLSATAILALGGCGSSTTDTDLAKGRQLFSENCGTCHTLAEAGTSASIGPNLDAAFAAARDAGETEDTIKGVVIAQIAHPRAADESDPTYMPPGLLEGQDAEDVAAYVGSVAGVPGIGPPTVPGGPGAQVFANNGCGSCHTLAAAGTSGTNGPNLDEVLPGQSTDEIKTDIVDPSAQIEQGFSDIMPKDFETSIPPDDLTALIKYLQQNAGKTKGAAGTSAP
jgi:mono/diheme cytochrome c family protein